MNLVPCDLSVIISNNQSYDNHFDISTGLNSIVYDLKEGTYDIQVKADDKCTSVAEKMTKLPFIAQGQVVSSMEFQCKIQVFDVEIIFFFCQRFPDS